MDTASTAESGTSGPAGTRIVAAGTAWDAVRVGRFLGLEALERLGSAAGPVLVDPAARTMYFLVPAGSTTDWDVPQSQALGETNHVVIPPRDPPVTSRPILAGRLTPPPHQHPPTTPGPSGGTGPAHRRTAQPGLPDPRPDQGLELRAVQRPAACRPPARHLLHRPRDSHGADGTLGMRTHLQSGRWSRTLIRVAGPRLDGVTPAHGRSARGRAR